MKRTIHNLGLLVLTLVVASLTSPAAGAQGAGEQQIVVPLSKPGSPVRLSASIFSGGIEVTAHDGKDVIVTARSPRVDETPRSADGMKLIPNTGMGLVIEEHGNDIEIAAEFTHRRIDLSIQVPVRTSVSLSTIHEGDLVVRGLTGEIELQNTNGGIEATDIRGSVLANTTNGEVIVTFIELAADRSMSFTTFNGDVDVTFTPSLKGDLRIDAGRGDIHTDFDVTQQPVEPKIDRSATHGGSRFEISGEVHVSVGGGGPAIHFKTFNGDVYIRKSGE